MAEWVPHLRTPTLLDTVLKYANTISIPGDDRRDPPDGEQCEPHDGDEADSETSECDTIGSGEHESAQS